MQPYDLLCEIERRWPARLAGTPAEREAQARLGEALAASGAALDWHRFTWPPHLYGALALHFGLGVLGAAVARRRPGLALALHAAAGVSFVSEATRRGLVLRNLWPAASSQNLLATFRAPGDASPVRRRLVLVAHADSAYTGLIFNPTVLRTVVGPPPANGGAKGKQLVLPTAALFGLAALDLLRLGGRAPRWVDVATALLALPPAVVAALNLEVVARNHVVPGAADNLSGCVAVVELARRLAPSLGPGVELVVAITGCEEAGTGGADRLARDMGGAWAKDTTTVVAIDTVTNGDLFWLEEGELSRITAPARLVEAIEATSAEAGMPKVERYVVPTGATDALPFLVRGWEAIALTSIDREIGAPRHYHHPTDTAANVSPEELGRSIDFAERFLRRLLAA
jgi:hypothetical protein